MHTQRVCTSVSYTVLCTANSTILESPVDSTANITQTTIPFICSAHGIPPPDISWFKDGSLLDPSTYDITDTVNRTSSVTNSVLVLNSLVVSSAGEYVCNASNDFSVATASFSFTVEGNTVEPQMKDQLGYKPRVLYHSYDTFLPQSHVAVIGIKIIQQLL